MAETVKSNTNSGWISRNERAQVESCKKKLEQCRSALEDFSSYGELFDNLQELETEMFIISTVGLLKAGKSTLVNLFARNKLASPTGYGKDTTLRPVIITQKKKDEKAQIEVWISDEEINQDNDSICKNNLNLIFKHIRGLKTDIKNQNLHCDTYELSEDNLKEILCEKKGENCKLPKEPVMVVIKLPQQEESLLSEKIMIMDTPGLDSFNSQWTNNSTAYCWALEKCDLALFLQSSVSPLNQKAEVVFKKLRADQSNTPIWLIHNKMDAKYWLKKDVRDKTSKSQISNANEIFENKFNSLSEIHQANLGMASSYYFEANDIDTAQNKEKLLQNSEFSDLEKKIKENLKNNAIKMRREKIINDICATKKKLKGEVELKVKELENQNDDLNKSCETNKKFFDKLKEGLKKANLQGISFEELRFTENNSIKHKKWILAEIDELSKNPHRESTVNNHISQWEKTLCERLDKEAAEIKFSSFQYKAEPFRVYLRNILKTRFESIINEDHNTKDPSKLAQELSRKNIEKDPAIVVNPDEILNEELVKNKFSFSASDAGISITLDSVQFERKFLLQNPKGREIKDKLGGSGASAQIYPDKVQKICEEYYAKMTEKFKKLCEEEFLSILAETYIEIAEKEKESLNKKIEEEIRKNNSDKGKLKKGLQNIDSAVNTLKEEWDGKKINYP